MPTINLSCISRALPRVNLLYRICRRYVYDYQGDNNEDIRTNGEMRLLKVLLPKCETVFDVGSNIGDWANCAVNINKKLYIHCFEPSLNTYKILKKNAKKNFVLNNNALSDHSGDSFLHIYKETAGSNSLYSRNGVSLKSKRLEKIKIDTIDSYLERNNISSIDFLKIDVEGNELKVLHGAKNALSKGDIRYIQFEYGGTYIDARIYLKDIFYFLYDYGYSLHKIYPKKIKHVPKYDQSLENFNYQNWLAVKND